MYYGYPFILMDLETGDCKRFQNTYELRKEFNLKFDYGLSLRDCLEIPQIKNKYKFFAYESDLLKYI